MTNFSANTTTTSPINVLEQEKLVMLYELQQAYVKRTKTPFSFSFITWHPSMKFPDHSKEEKYKMLYDYIAKQVRHSDTVFTHLDSEFVIVLLALSGEIETDHFLTRFFSGATEYFKSTLDEQTPTFIATNSTVYNSNHSLNEILELNAKQLKKMVVPFGNSTVVIDSFAEPELEHVKVSILENNEIKSSILNNLISNSDIPNFQLNIKTFQDGFEFLQSDWYKSAHTHIVILNDILPRQNGIDVLNQLRALPNEEKYIIIMISSRNTEDAVLYAFDQGVDAYFTNPFNLRLLETQIKNILRRLR